MPVGISYRAMLAAAGSSAAADAYIVNSFSPPVVADFAGVLNSGTEYYRVGGVDSDFASMFTFSRASSATQTNSSGNLVTVSSGVARRNHHRYNGSTYDNKGILLESEARTNLITSSDVMSGWTTNNMTVAKNQTGADGVANSAHSLTATSGSATVLTTITAASNPHVYSALVKRITGTGTIEMTVNGGSTWVNVTSLINSSEFIQVGTGAGTTVTNPQVGFRITTSGDAIAVQVNQLEQTSGGFSSPIPTSGATVTRAAEELLLNTSGHPINGTDFSWHITGTLSYQTNNNEVFTIQNNTSNYTLARFATDGDLDVFNFTSAGDSNDETTTFAAVNLSAGDVFDYSIASRVDSGVEANAALNGTAGTAGSYGTTPNFTSATAYLDGRPFNRPPMHNVELLRIWPTADIGDTGIESATS